MDLTLKKLIRKLKSTSKASQHNSMVTYMLFLLRRYSHLESEIILKIFIEKATYQMFIGKELPEKTAHNYCKQIKSFLLYRGYPPSFVEYRKQMNLLKLSSNQ